MRYPIANTTTMRCVGAIRHKQIKKKMQTVNSISGGKTSSYMAVHFPADVNIFACVCIDYVPAAPKDKAVLNYALNKLNGNFIASAERQKTLKVVMDLEQLIGKEIVWVRGKSFDQVIDEAGCLPTWNRRFCTTEMKIIPMFQYLFPRYGITLQNIGFRADEPDRIKRGEVSRPIEHPMSCKNFGMRFQNWEHVDWQIKQFPLRQTFHYQIKNWWDANHPEFDFPWDSNCAGCHHKPAEVINKNYKDDPEILTWFSIQEKKGKWNTWHDDLIPYEQIFKTEYLNLFSSVSDFTMCDSGGCTD